MCLRLSQCRTACRIALATLSCLVVCLSNVSAQGTVCQGRCQYGVEGSCRPRSLTYGHYQSTWRKWPVAPPDVVRRQADDNRLSTDIELPRPFDEADPDPEFPHLQERASGNDEAFNPGSMEMDDSNFDESLPEIDTPVGFRRRSAGG